jgi:hypothetical protein
MTYSTPRSERPPASAVGRVGDTAMRSPTCQPMAPAPSRSSSCVSPAAASPSRSVHMRTSGAPWMSRLELGPVSASVRVLVVEVEAEAAAAVLPRMVA